MKLVDNRANYTLEDSAFGNVNVILIILHRIAAIPIKSWKIQMMLEECWQSSTLLTIYFIMNF